MGHERFDHFLRSLSTRPSRRVVLAGLTGGLFAALPLALSVEDSAARKKRRGKKHKKHSPHQGQPDSPPASPSPPATPPPSPAPVTQADAACGAQPDDEVELLGGDARIAQTFTAGITGSLVSADLQIVKQAGSGGAFILRLSPVDGTGIPTNAILASAAIPNLSVSPGPNDLTFTFANPATVIAGTTYALVLTRPGSNSLIWFGHTGNTCSGQVWFSTSQAGGFQSAAIDSDLNFVTFVSA